MKFRLKKDIIINDFLIRKGNDVYIKTSDLDLSQKISRSQDEIENELFESKEDRLVGLYGLYCFNDKLNCKEHKKILDELLDYVISNVDYVGYMGIFKRKPPYKKIRNFLYDEKEEDVENKINDAVYILSYRYKELGKAEIKDLATFKRIYSNYMDWLALQINQVHRISKSMARKKIKELMVS